MLRKSNVCSCYFTFLSISPILVIEFRRSVWGVRMKKRLWCLVLVVILLMGNVFPVFAVTVNDVKQQQTETKNRLNEINKSISAIENKKQQVRKEISNLNADLVDTMLELELLEADLEQKQVEIDEAQAEYDSLKQLEEQQYEAMKLRIQYMYERGAMDYIALILEAKSISDLVNRADFAREVSAYDDEKVTEYEETKLQVQETKERLEGEQEILLELQQDQLVYKRNLDKQIQAAQSKVKNFDAELANAQAKAKEYQKTIKEQNALISKLSKEGTGNQKPSNSNTGSSGANGGQTAPSTNKPSSGTPTVSGGDGTLGASIASYALQFVGNPYVSGGTSLTDGADCSGFTWAVHKHFGISIPRVSRDQAKGGKPVDLDAIMPGDILYYVNHVAIYIGNGRIVHASTEKTGIKTDRYNYRTPSCARRYW